MKFTSNSFGLCGHLGVPGNPGNLTAGIYEMQLSLVLSLSLPPPFSMLLNRVLAFLEPWFPHGDPVI